MKKFRNCEKDNYTNQVWRRSNCYGRAWVTVNWSVTRLLGIIDSCYLCEDSSIKERRGMNLVKPFSKSSMLLVPFFSIFVHWDPKKWIHFFIIIYFKIFFCVKISLINIWLMVVVTQCPFMMTTSMGITIASFLESIGLELFY